MFEDDTYSQVAVHLQRAGQWDLALAHVTSPDQRAEILTDRFMWQLTGADEAIEAAGDASPDVRDFVLARISYWHKLGVLDNSPVDIDELAIFSRFETAWGAFWCGVVQDNVKKDKEAAAAAYAKARNLMGDDIFLESYVVRHEAFHLADSNREKAIALARRSVTLRSALGARPHTAAAQLALVQVLPEGDPEAAELTTIVKRTANELNLAWVKQAVA